MEELDWPAQTAGLNSTPAPLGWTGMQLWARSYHQNISFWPHKCSCGRMGENPSSHIPKSWGKHSQTNGGGYCSTLIPIAWELNIQQSHMGVMLRCLHTFGHTYVWYVHFYYWLLLLVVECFICGIHFLCYHTKTTSFQLTCDKVWNLAFSLKCTVICIISYFSPKCYAAYAVISSVVVSKLPMQEWGI